MAHNSTDRHIEAFKPKLTTTRRLKTMCSSKHEAHVGDLLEMYDIKYKHEAVTLTVDDLPSGQVTPDYIVNDPFYPGKLMCIEPKGADTERALATFEDYEKICDDPASDFTSYVLVKFAFMKLHRDGRTGPAAFYRCDDCGGVFFDFKKNDNRHCPHCGETASIVFVTARVNEYVREVDKKIYAANWIKREAEIKARQAAFDEAKAYEIRLVNRIKEVRRELGWKALVDGEVYGVVVGSDYAYEETVPDFVYEELPNPFYLMGHATPPLVLVSVCEMPSENDELVFEEIAEAVAEGNTIVKHAIISSDGVRVVDWTTNGAYLKGGIYICDEPDCGKPYIAQEHHDCPYCGGSHRHAYKRGE